MAKVRESVNLRSRKMKNGGETLYLDYFLNGKRHREFLGLYLGKDKAVNANVMNLAQRMKAEKIMLVDSIKSGIHAEEYAGRSIMLEDYAMDYVKNLKTSTRKLYTMVLKNLKGCGYTLAQVDRRVFSTLLNSMSEGVSASTKRTYGAILRSVMLKAKREGILKDLPDFSSLMPRAKPKEKVFLTIDEIRDLTELEFRNKYDVKEAFLFACFTGLRYCDILQLKYDDIEDGVLRIKQQKTEDVVSIPLSENAKKFLPEHTGRKTIFKLPSDVSIVEKILRRMASLAGIKKYLTFHCSRHTCATLLLLYGADLLTVSKILGHASVSTTQIYTKVLDEGKRKAVNNVPSI